MTVDPFEFAPKPPLQPINAKQAQKTYGKRKASCAALTDRKQEAAATGTAAISSGSLLGTDTHRSLSVTAMDRQACTGTMPSSSFSRQPILVQYDRISRGEKIVRASQPQSSTAPSDSTHDAGEDFTLNAKNPHEILEAGKTSKFKDELEYLLDGLGTDQTSSVRRASLLEILVLVLQPDYCSKFRALGYAHRVFEMAYSAARPNDPIIMLLFSLMLLIFSSRKYQMHYLFFERGFVLLMCDYLKHEDLLGLFFADAGFLDRRASELQLDGHAVKKIRNLRARILKQHLIEPTEKVSYSSLAMRYLYQLAAVKSRTDNTREAQRALIAAGVLPCVFQFFQQSGGFTFALLEHAGSNISAIGTFLQIIEYLSVDSDSAVLALADFLSQFKGYSVGLLETLFALAEREDSQSYQLTECLINFLKILVNMSNAISTYSFFSTQPELVLTLLSHLFQCPVPASYDLALLIYGLLSNLFEKSRLLRELFRSSTYRHVCRHKGYCREGCLFEGLSANVGCLTAIVRLFRYHCDHQLNGSMEAFIAPYISLSICQLIVESETEHDPHHAATCLAVKGFLPGESLSPLIESLEQLIQLYTICDSFSGIAMPQFKDLLHKMKRVRESFE